MPINRPGDLAQRIKALRKAKGLSQAEFAKMCGIDQASIAKVELGKLRPNGRVIVELAKLSGKDQWWWLEQIGLKPGDLGMPVDPSDIVQVPLFKDRISAGAGSIIDERNIEGYIKMSRDRLPSRARDLHAAMVTGDSMHPIIQEGFTVFIDTAERDYKRLLKRMVAAREGEFITIKWLWQEGSFYQLVPENVNDRNRVRILSPENDVAIIGRVVMWIGLPRK